MASTAAGVRLTINVKPIVDLMIELRARVERWSISLREATITLANFIARTTINAVVKHLAQKIILEVTGEQRQLIDAIAEVGHLFQARVRNGALKGNDRDRGKIMRAWREQRRTRRPRTMAGVA